MNNTFEPDLKHTLYSLFEQGRGAAKAPAKRKSPVNQAAAGGNVLHRDGNVIAVRFGAART